ncbi:MAG: prolyl oligopeptidase family serine peptidase [Polymorphobacter sp.]
MRILFALAALPLLASVVHAAPDAVKTGPAKADPNAYLEEVEGPAAIAQVKAWNAATLKVLTATPGFEANRARARALLEDDTRIATPDTVQGGQVFNLWRDAANPRGLWRSASLASFTAGKPQWRVLIDVDALGKAEGRSWVWGGAVCRAPAYVRCMVAVADGGTDAEVWREFDMTSAQFVPGGFALPAAKASVAWAGDDALYVATDFGAGSMTTSGYPRIVKRWARGTALDTAALVAQGQTTDVRMVATVIVDGDRQWPLVYRGIDFYTAEISHVAADGRLVRSPLPTDAVIEDIIDGRVIAKLITPLDTTPATIPAGALVDYDLVALLGGQPAPIAPVLLPTPSQSIEQASGAASVLWVKLLDDVSGKLLALRRGADGRWSQTAMPLAANATVRLDAVAGPTPLAFATVEGLLLPPTLYALTPGAAAQQVQQVPPRFDASTMNVEQRFAKSKDGTRVPYFLVRKPGARGPVPALVHAYGGFRAAQTPTYLVEQPYRAGPVALFWVEAGNAYVLANIRGGSEYGPAWHKAGLREKRQNVFDDLHAVAEDLVATGVSAKGRIAISGRSNGGLLVGVAMEQRPDLYGAVVMGSPLIDMARYSKLLAGASWMGEYGDPDVAADWAFISAYSPYQNLRAGVKYPAPYIYTSTKDDRVHPGHARKFAARLEALGDPFFYAEALEGGHAAGADRIEDAQRAALIMAYLQRQLPPVPR